MFEYHAALMSAEIRVKGTVLAGIVRASGAHTAGPVRDALLERLTGDLRLAVETNSLMPTVWYPVAWHRELLAFVREQGGKARLEETIRHTTRDTVSTVHRLLMRAFSPDMLMTRTARIFSTFFEGRCDASLRSPGFTVVRWSECRGFDANCWAAQLHTVDELVSMTGVKSFQRTVLDGGRNGDTSMGIEIHW
jgi:hypothetical protein